jgi:small subunit ribosomal protein S16
MPVKLRLRRTGAKHQPRYRIVAADSRSPRDGRFIEVIGYYIPTRQPHEVVINAELAQKWLSRGAQPTDTVRDLLAEQGLLAPTERPAAPTPPKVAEPTQPAAATVAEQPSAEAAQPPAEPAVAKEAPEPETEPAAPDVAAEASADTDSAATDTSA